MTRKRFVKLLMSEGWSRNSANEIAKFAWDRKGGYAALYNELRGPYNRAMHAIKKIAPIIEETVNGFCRGIAVGMNRLGYSLAVALSDIFASLAENSAYLSDSYAATAKYFEVEADSSPDTDGMGEECEFP